MTTSTPIANSNIAAQAFIMAELAPISSFADDTEQASSARLFYRPALSLCLADYDWSFARRLVNLAEVVLPTELGVDDDLPHTYLLPADFVELRSVVPPTLVFRRDENFLRAEQSGGLKIRYTRMIENEDTLPAAFRTAVSAQLALLFSPRWVKSRTKRQELQDNIETYLGRAKKNDKLSASNTRSDGQALQGDWVNEATR